jgi:hypothetical protein
MPSTAPDLVVRILIVIGVACCLGTPDGKAPGAAQLEEARRIIESRVNGLGVSEAQVVTEGDRDVVVSVPGQSNDEIKQIGYRRSCASARCSIRRPVWHRVRRPSLRAPRPPVPPSRCPLWRRSSARPTPRRRR